MAILPAHTPPLRRIVDETPVELTAAERYQLERDYRLIDGRAGEWLDIRERDHLLFVEWLIRNGKHGKG